jgi:hypothetical protein
VHSQFDVSGRPSSYIVEPAANRFGLINAFTNAAQKLGPLQRIEMERFAGQIAVRLGSVTHGVLISPRDVSGKHWNKKDSEVCLWNTGITYDTFVKTKC